MEYGYYETYRGCEIFRINDSGVKEYVQRVYKDEITWTRDYTFARHYALVSAEKMIEKLNSEFYGATCCNVDNSTLVHI